MVVFLGEACGRGAVVTSRRLRLAGVQSCHHPFTAPIAEHEALLRSIASSGGKRDSAALSQLLTIRAQHYDLVFNGVEIAGGSIRYVR